MNKSCYGQRAVHRRSTGLKFSVSGCFLDYPGYEVIVMLVFYTFRRFRASRDDILVFLMVPTIFASLRDCFVTL